MLSQELKKHLLWWWEHRPFKDVEHIFVCLEATPFCGEYQGKPFQKRRHLMGRLCKRAGVKPFGFHAIRHLTASYLDRQGVELRLIQGILRHRSAMTTSRYLHSLRGAGEVLDAVMPKMPKGKVIPIPPERMAVAG